MEKGCGPATLDYVIPMAKTGITRGADGLMIEVHIRPETAVSDGIQSLKPAIFQQMMREIAPFAQAAGHRM